MLNSHDLEISIQIIEEKLCIHLFEHLGDIRGKEDNFYSTEDW